MLRSRRRLLSLLALIAGGCGGTLWARHVQTLRLAERTVVICPFLNLIPGKPDRGLHDDLRYAFADDLVARLSARSSRSLIVRSDPRNVDGCALAVFGSFGLVDNVRLSAQASLVDASGRTVWSEAIILDRFHTDELVDRLLSEVEEAVRDRLGRPRAGPRDPSGLALLCRGAAKLEGGDAALQEAISDLGRAQAQLPDPRQARLRLGLAHWLLGEFDVALDVWHSRLGDNGDMDPDTAMVLLAAAAEASGVSWECERTLAVARKAAASLPNCPLAQETVARLALISKDDMTARTAAERACLLSLQEREPPEPWSGARRLLLLADAAAATGDIREERCAVAAAALLFPSRPAVRYHAARLGIANLQPDALSRIAEASRSEAVRQTAIRCRPDYRPERLPPLSPPTTAELIRSLKEDPFSCAYRRDLLRRFTDYRRFDEAEALFRKLSAGAPTIVPYRQGVVAACMARRDWLRNEESALSALRAVREFLLCPTATPQARLDAIRSLVERGLFLDEARRMLDRLEIEQDDARYLMVRGWLAIQRHDFQSGERDLHRVLQSVPRGGQEYLHASARIADSALRQGEEDRAMDAAAGTGTLVYGWPSARAADGTRCRLVGLGRTLAAFDLGGARRHWSFAAGSNVTALTVGDLDGDGAEEIAVGTDRDGEDRGVLYLLRADGTLRWAYRVAASGVFSDDDSLSCQAMQMAELTGRPPKEIVVIAGHSPGYVGRMVALMDCGDRAELIGEFWTVGIIQALAAGMTSAGPRILLTHVDNGASSAYMVRRVVIDPRRLKRSRAEGPDGDRRLDPVRSEAASRLEGNASVLCAISPQGRLVLPRNGLSWLRDAGSLRWIRSIPTPRLPPEDRISRWPVPAERLGDRPPASPSEFRAVVVGVSETPCADLESLPSAASDADYVARMLISRWGYPAGLVRTFTGKAARNTAILDALRRSYDQARPGDTVLIYWSGHAFYVDGNGYLATADTTAMTAKGGALCLAELLDTIETNLTGCHVVMLVDACSAFRDLGAVLVRLNRAREGATRLASLTIWPGCSPGEEAYSPRTGGPSVFTRALFECAHQHRLDSISPDDLAQEVCAAVKSQAAARGRRQTPQVFGDLPDLWRSRAGTAAR